MRRCFFVLTRKLTQFEGYVGNRAVAMHRPWDADFRFRESWHPHIQTMVKHWNVLRLPERLSP